MAGYDGRQGTSGAWAWWFERPTGEQPEIWAYTSELSYAPGDEIAFHVHTTASAYALRIERDGAEREVVWERSGLLGAAHETPADSYARGCGWPVELTVPVPAGWRSGGYVAILTATCGERTVVHEHWFAIRAAQPDPSALLLIAATATWTAYSAWGGANHYEGIAGGDGDGHSPILSLQRPWGRGTAVLPIGAQRVAHTGEVPIGWTPRYPSVEWALANGYPKFYASAGWAMYEALFVRWAERNGYEVHVATQHDLQLRPELLDGYRCVVLTGHNEYWSWEMRDRLDAFADAGGGVAHLAGNFLWQIRLEQDGAVQVCHKYDAHRDDPVARDPERRHLLTSAWDDRAVGRPAARTMGLTAIRGMYAKVSGNSPRGAGGYTVYRPDHWVFEGCDLYYGDLLGAAHDVLSYEVDGLAYTIRDGLPYATGEDGIDAGAVEILALGVASVREEQHGHRDAVHICGDEEAILVSRLLHGEATPETMERVSRGAGMAALYRRGRGQVFNAGACEWVAALQGGDPFVARATDNVLRRFLAAGGA